MIEKRPIPTGNCKSRSKKVFQYAGQVTVIIFLLIVVAISVNRLLAYRSSQVEAAKVDTITNCNEAENLFQADLARGVLRYFTFGLAPDVKHESMLRDKYHLDVYYMGCLARHGLICYNEMVDERLGIPSQHSQE